MQMLLGSLYSLYILIYSTRRDCTDGEDREAGMQMLLGSLNSLYILIYSTRTACTDGEEREARMQMLLGSLYAGMAFANAPCAAVHALAYPIGKPCSFCGHISISSSFSSG